jgi:hypothetical protein
MEMESKIKQYLLQNAEIRLQNEYFQSYFSDDKVVGILTNAIINRKCISLFYVSKTGEFRRQKGVPEFRRNEIYFAFGKIFDYLTESVLEIKSGDKNVERFSLINKHSSDDKYRLITDFIAYKQPNQQLAGTLAKLANTNKTAIYFVTDTNFNIVKYTAKVYTLRIGNSPIVVFEPLIVGEIAVDRFYLPKPSISFISFYTRIVQIDFNNETLFKTDSFTETENNERNTRVQRSMQKFQQILRDNDE